MKNSYRHYTSDEVHIAWNDPSVVEDNPAGPYSRIQRRKWRIWYNATNKKLWIRRTPLHNEWLLLYDAGVTSTCPVPLTRTALLALRASNSLSKDCDYVITDHVQGRLVAGTQIHLQAVSSNELSENVSVNTTYDNEAWRGIYDIDRGLVLELQDNRNNVVRGINGTEVSNFDWGNTSYTNVLVDNATLTVDIANTVSKTNVTVKEGSVLTLTGFTGSISNFQVFAASNVNFTNANGIWRNTRVSDAVFWNLTGYTGGGDNYGNNIWAGSNLNFSGTTTNITLRNSDVQNTVITHNGVTTGTTSINRSRLNVSTITKTNGALVLTIDNCDFRTNPSITHNTGTLTVNNTTIESSGYVLCDSAAGNTTLTGCQISKGAYIQNRSVATANVTRVVAEGDISRVELINGSTGLVTLLDVKFSNGAYLQKEATSTGNISVSYSTFDQQAILLSQSAVGIGVSRTTVSGNSYVYALNGSGGNINLIDSILDSQSYIVKSGTSTTGNITVNASVFSGGSFMSMQGTGSHSIFQSSFSGSSGISNPTGDRSSNMSRIFGTNVGRINLSGTGAVTDGFSDCNLNSRGSISISNSGPANAINYVNIAGLSGALSISGTTGTQTIQRLTLLEGSFSLVNVTAGMTHDLNYASQAGIIQYSNVTAPKSLTYSRVENATVSVLNATTTGSLTRLNAQTGGTITVSGTCGSVSSAECSHGAIQFNGGATHANVLKTLGGTLTTNNFSTLNIAHHSPISKTLTANNTNRVDYLGLVSAAPLI